MARRSIPFVLAALLACGGTALAEGGQGPADPNAVLDDLNLGTYWYGKQISKDDLEGKVVLVEIWGS